MRTQAQKLSTRIGNVFQYKGKNNVLVEQDLSNIKIINSSVDKVKQLYSGILDKEVYKEIVYTHDAGFNAKYEYMGVPFIITKAGNKAGYRYILKNNEFGMTILLGSFHTKINIDDEESKNQKEEESPHLKIECSPNLILSSEVHDLQRLLNRTAKHFLTSYQPSGIAIHLCTDFQGWQIPNDFDERFVCRSQIRSAYSGIKELEFDTSSVIATYGKNQTKTAGSASGIQFTIYDKWQNNHQKDEVDFWEKVWSKTLGYKSSTDTYRIEFRYSHNVINQYNEAFKQQGHEEIKTYQQCSKILNKLWSQGLIKFRLHANQTTIDPLWQLLEEDVVFNDLYFDSELKRVYKKPSSSKKSIRNTFIMLGYITSNYARRGFDLDDVIEDMKKSELLWLDIMFAFAQKGIWEQQAIETIKETITDKRILGC